MMRSILKSILIGLSFTIPAWISLVAFGQTAFDPSNSVSRKPFVEFLARGATIKPRSPGHSLVGLGIEFDNGLRVYTAVYGFYPKEKATSVATAVKLLKGTKGKIELDWVDLQMHTESYMATRISDSDYDKVKMVFERWKSNSPQYSVLGTNCNYFVSQVAATVGLKLPTADPGTTFPTVFVRKLQEINKAKYDKYVQEVAEEVSDEIFGSFKDSDWEKLIFPDGLSIDNDLSGDWSFGFDLGEINPAPITSETIGGAVQKTVKVTGYVNEPAQNPSAGSETPDDERSHDPKPRRKNTPVSITYTWVDTDGDGKTDTLVSIDVDGSDLTDVERQKIRDDAKRFAGTLME